MTSWQIVFWAAAAYNLVIGACGLFQPGAAREGRVIGLLVAAFGGVYAIVALDPTVKAVPEDVRKHAEAARKAGVRLVACRQALEKYDIDEKMLVPQAEVTENAITELSRLVAERYQIIRY